MVSELTLHDFPTIKLSAEKQAPEFARRRKTHVFFLSRHCLLLETKYILCFEPFFEKLQSSTCWLQMHLPWFCRIWIWVHLGKTLLVLLHHESDRQLAARKLCLSRETKIYQRFKHLNVGKDKQKKMSEASCKYCFFLVTDLMGFQQAV